jgi:hypothetical protein
MKKIADRRLGIENRLTGEAILDFQSSFLDPQAGMPGEARIFYFYFFTSLVDATSIIQV